MKCLSYQNGMELTDLELQPPQSYIFITVILQNRIGIKNQNTAL